MFVLVCDADSVLFEGEIELLLERLHSVLLIRQAQEDIRYWYAIMEDDESHVQLGVFTPVHEDGPFSWIEVALNGGESNPSLLRVFMFASERLPHATIVTRSSNSSLPQCWAYMTEEDMLSNRPESWVPDTEQQRRRYFTEVLVPGYTIRGRFESATVIATRIG
jgi:hypothetical protein